MCVGGFSLIQNQLNGIDFELVVVFLLLSLPGGSITSFGDAIGLKKCA